MLLPDPLARLSGKSKIFLSEKKVKNVLCFEHSPLISSCWALVINFTWLTLQVVEDDAVTPVPRVEVAAAADQAQGISIQKHQIEIADKVIGERNAKD